MFKKSIVITILGISLIFSNAQAQAQDDYPLQYSSFNAEYLIEECLKAIVIHCNEGLDHKKDASICVLGIEEELGYLKSWILRNDENFQIDQ